MEFCLADIVSEHGLDVFGLPPSKKQYDCICPNCQRNMAASRFAPHLEKCMGMGRLSSRIASRRYTLICLVQHVDFCARFISVVRNSKLTVFLHVLDKASNK